MSERERQKEVYVSHDLTPPAPFFTFYFRSESSSVVQFRYTPHYVHNGSGIRTTTAFILPFYCPQFEFNARFVGDAAVPLFNPAEQER